MSRVCRLILAVVAALCLTIPVFAQDDDIIVDVTPTTGTHQLDISFSTSVPHQLFQQGQPVSLTAHITNAGTAQSVSVSTRVTDILGCGVYADDASKNIGDTGGIDIAIPLTEEMLLPNGVYLVTVTAIGETDSVSKTTRVAIWPGPSAQQSQYFGISYAGALDSQRALSDLDLFKQAGIGWLRFPLQGWLPQGGDKPAETGIYDAFVREAGDRGFTLLATFSPKVTVDASINPAQTEKDYQASLHAAAARYNYKVKAWELLCVNPPAYPVGMKGIRYEQISAGRTTLQQVDKSLQAVFAIDQPFAANSLELLHTARPMKGDAYGIHYNFVNIPEIETATPKPPLPGLAKIADDSKSTLKFIPGFWVTEYGFDPAKVSKPPHAGYQAANMARAIILNRASGIERTFWRHDPSDGFALPFTTDDGSVQPSLLAVRTTLQALEGVTRMEPIPTSTASDINKLHVFMLQYGGDKKKKIPTRYGMITWCEKQSGRLTMAIKSSATKITVTDLWGNAIDLQPVENTAIFQVDEFPRFLDLGAANDAQLINASGSASFDSGFKVISPDGDNTALFSLRNDPQLFNSKGGAGEVRFRMLPVGTKVITKEYELDAPYKVASFKLPLDLPENKVNGREVYEVGVEIMMGARRVGYVTLPVFYSAATSRPTEE